MLTPMTQSGSAALGLLLTIAGGIGLLLSLPGALLEIRYVRVVTASVAIVIAAAGWILYSRGGHSRATGAGAIGALAWEGPATLAAIVLTGLWGYSSIKTGQMDQWDDKDEVERIKAPAWDHDLDTLQGGMRWEDVRSRLSKEGYKARCYQLGPDEGMEPGDTHTCWTIVSRTWDIPARTIIFMFGPEGLRQVRIDYGKEQWPAVKDWFDRLPGTATGTFGRDHGGSVIVGKVMASGQVLTAEPERLSSIVVLWQARSRLQETLCKKSKHDLQWNLICKPSNP
jgi:hypothetical protein